MENSSNTMSKTALENNRQLWPEKSDEWLFERLSNELKQKVETIHGLLSGSSSKDARIAELEKEVEEAEKVIKKAEKYHQGGHSEIGHELREWLTNKTE